MGLKSYVNSKLLLEGGNALKGTVGIKQKHVAALHAAVIPKIAKELRLSTTQVLPIGSAGRKPNPEDVSGDVDIAIQTLDIPAVQAAIERLGAATSHRSMSGINVYSFGWPHPDGVVQVDLMPVSNLKLAAWAFYSADADMQAGLKGSHRNEVLFALAKYVAMKHHGIGPVPDAERDRYQLDLNFGLFKTKQSRMGKKGPVKSYSTVNKELLTSDPDEICRLLFGYNVPASALLSLDDVMRALHDDRFAFAKARADVIAAAIAGCERKELELPTALAKFKVSRTD
jgi:hypothetical protein